jgi:predicted enzyme related to lactoylglutathione lyase
MALNKGKEVAALCRTDGEQDVSHWRSFVSVSSADDASAKALILGGSVLVPSWDVPEAGRMALLQDPAGAVFGVWEPRQHIGVRLTGEPGTFYWNELDTRDAGTAQSFYARLFGWGSRPMIHSPTSYTIFTREGVDEAGMMPLPAEHGDTPPNWLVYFLVTSCDQSVARAGALGARIMKAATDIASVGRFAVLRDPQGAVFALFTPARSR